MSPMYEQLPGDMRTSVGWLPGDIRTSHFTNGFEGTFGTYRHLTGQIASNGQWVKWISHCMKVGVLKQWEQQGKGSTRATGVLG